MQAGKQLRREARARLKGHWLTACFLLLITTLIAVLVPFIEEATSILFHISYFQDTAETPNNYLDNTLAVSPLVLLTFGGGLLLRLCLASPFALGQKSWYQHLAAGDPAPLRNAFRFFSSLQAYCRSVLFTVQLYIRRFLLVFLCFLPLIALWLAFPFFLRFSIPQELFWLLLLLTAVILFLACTAVSAYWLGRYFLAEYILVLFPCKIRDAFKLSAIVMKERKNEWLSLLIGLLPCYLADLLVVPRLFTVPYRSAVYARYAQYFMESYEKAREAVSISDRAAEFATREFSCPS